MDFLFFVNDSYLNVWKMLHVFNLNHRLGEFSKRQIDDIFFYFFLFIYFILFIYLFIFHISHCKQQIGFSTICKVSYGDNMHEMSNLFSMKKKKKKTTKEKRNFHPACYAFITKTRLENISKISPPKTESFQKNTF